MSDDPDRPQVVVNCAVSLDGKLAYAQGRRARLSSPDDLARVQALRASADAIVVGAGTVLADDPSLRVHWEMLGRPPGRAPTRVILDSRGRTPPTARILDGSLPTLVVTSDSNRTPYPASVQVARLPGSRVDLAGAFRAVADRAGRRILVEGGAELLASLLPSPLWDELTVYVAPVLIGGSTAPSLVAGPECADDASAVHLEFTGSESAGEGVVLRYVPRR